MCCKRCNGTLEKTYFILGKPWDAQISPCVRCINCGDYFDAVILKNREKYYEMST